MTIQRQASAIWTGGLKNGTGFLNSSSGVLKNTEYSFATRFENRAGTNPEELIAAAHAGCFSMALSAQLNALGLNPAEIRTTAAVGLEKIDGAWEIATVHLNVSATVPGATQEQFLKAAQEAKSGCPVSKVLNAKITLEARLEAQAA